jgi:hypothetical protein
MLAGTYSSWLSFSSPESSNRDAELNQPSNLARKSILQGSDIAEDHRRRKSAASQKLHQAGGQNKLMDSELQANKTEDIRKPTGERVAVAALEPKEREDMHHRNEEAPSTERKIATDGMAELSQKTSSLGVIEHLETSVTPVAGIDCLITSAQQAFQLVEPWCQAKPLLVPSVSSFCVSDFEPYCADRTIQLSWTSLSTSDTTPLPTLTPLI